MNRTCYQIMFQCADTRSNEMIRSPQDDGSPPVAGNMLDVSSVLSMKSVGSL